ncbi:OmpA family protein [Candidatus Poribacteria bacterium]|nr:OmpA family protein [Candidatus Poribacteria bacterium]
MKLKGPILLFIIIAVVMVAIFFVRPMIFEKRQRATSDATVETKVIKIGGDGYLGYWFITSPEMRMHAPRQGLEIDFTDDGGAYAERLRKFASKEYDCIILPVNSYLQHGANHKFPGVIAASISESKGADAIVGFGDVVPTGKINELNDPNIRIVYTSESPSSFLLDLTISDFDLDQLKGNNNPWRSEVSSSEEAYKRAKKSMKDRSVGDAFVMWEPEVSKAIEELGMKYIWGSDKFAGYIVDVFVFHRDFVSKNPEMASNFLKTYFRVMDIYSADQERMIEEMSKSTNLKKNVVENMVEKIDWYDLHENCSQQFGIPVQVGAQTDDRVFSTIISCMDVLARSGNFDASKLRDPYKIVNSKFLEDLAKKGITQVGTSQSAKVVFAQLDESGWKALREVGTMRVEPITFQSGTNRLDDPGKEVVDRVAQMLTNNYPNYRVAIRGHTGPGDAKANQELSLRRAQVVLQRLIAVHSIDTNRLHAEGLGATQPPERKPGESTRSLRLRMPRVEFVLLERSRGI